MSEKCEKCNAEINNPVDESELVKTLTALNKCDFPSRYAMSESDEEDSE